MNLAIPIRTLGLFATGVAFLGLEITTSPMALIGRYSESLRPLAELWNQVGATIGITIFIVLGIVGSRHGFRQTFAMFTVCISTVGVVAQLLKHMIGRARPGSLSGATHFFGPFAWFNVDRAVRVDSMPSGHTAAAFAMAVALSWRWPNLGYLWYTLAIGVGVSRVITTAHFPSDVIFGAVVGFATSTIVLSLFKSLPPSARQTCDS